MVGEYELLDRAHALFAGPAQPAVVPAVGHDAVGAAPNAAAAGAFQRRYAEVAAGSRATLLAAARTDAALSRVLHGAGRDHTAARTMTAQVLAAARADDGAGSDSPVAQREALRRSIARLRAQHRHVRTARSRAARRLLLLRLLRYRARRRRAARARGLRLPLPNTRAGIAVRAALSKLGRPYVWGASGPDAFDCSGLVQWAYQRAGVQLDRTTYDQINQGIAVPRSQVQPGDLVFPNRGHVQLAIGNGQVVEAPFAGASVRISALGDAIAIRRPLA